MIRSQTQLNKIKQLVQHYAVENLAYAVADKQLLILTSNPKFNQWIDGHPETVVGQRLPELFIEVIGLEGIIQDVFQQNRETIELVKIQRFAPTQEHCYMNLRIEPLSNTDSWLLVSIKDATAECLLEEQLTQERNGLRLTIARLEKAERALDEVNGALARRVVALAVLNHITQTISNFQHLDAALQSVAETVTRQLDFFGMLVSIFYQARQESRIVALYPTDSLLDLIGQTLPLQESPLTQFAFEKRQPVVISDPQTNTLTKKYHDYLRAEDVQAMLLVPIINHGDFVGLVIVAIKRQTVSFTTDEIYLIETIVGQMSGAIENAQLFEEEQRQRHLAEGLFDVATTLTRSLHQKEVIPRILQQLGRVIEYDSATILLPEDGGLKVLDSIGFDKLEMLSKLQFSLDEDNLATQVYYSQLPVYVGDVEIHPSWDVTKSAGSIRSWLGVPLLFGSDSMGVLTIDSASLNKYNQADAQVAQTFANQAAIAIHNAQLFDAVQHQRAVAEQALEELKATQQELVQQEKMAALGQLIAGIAHEINTPLGAIQASIGNISAAFDHTLKSLPELLDNITIEERALLLTLIETAMRNSVHLSFREERKIRRQLADELAACQIQEAEEVAETLVSMGITADVQTFMPLLQSELGGRALDTAYYLSVQQTDSQNIALAIERASKMVFALKSYARFDASGELVQAQVIEGLELVLTIYHNQLKQGIEIIRQYADAVPAIPCYPDELNQVWTNLIYNAIQAMSGQGRLELLVSEKSAHEAKVDFGEQPAASYVVVEIIDSGTGIPVDLQPRVFEPFFTTKPSGEGSGLGLNICQKIVAKHNGLIQVESQPGRTIFQVWLPTTAPISDP